MPWRKPLLQEHFRDVSAFFAYIREICLGRKYNLHNRFAPKLAPRTIPPPDIPRTPEYKYSDQYYYKRAVFHSVHPPLVAPIAEGPPIASPRGKTPPAAGFKPDAVCFETPPTPGVVWWWDGHFYYETTLDPPPPPPVPKVSFTSPCPDPPPSQGPKSTCPPGYPPCPETKYEEHPPPCPRPPTH